MSGQCNRKTIIGHLHDIITFIIIKCRQMKILKKTVWFGVSNSQGTKNTETATQCFTDMAVL